MSTQAALDRFALLTQLPALSTLEEKCRVLADAAYATVRCGSATVVAFSGNEPLCIGAPAGTCIEPAAKGRGAREAFFSALRGAEVPGGYYLEDGSAAARGVFDGNAPLRALVLPLEAAGMAGGALVLQVESRPSESDVRELRTFADLAAWMLEQDRELSAADREANQSALLALINERARNSVDRQAILEAIVEDIRAAFHAARCAVFGRDPHAPDRARLLAAAEAPGCGHAPSTVALKDTWLERAFQGVVVGREAVAAENPNDAFLCALGAGSAILVPLVIEGRVEHAITLHFSEPGAFDEMDLVMLRSVGSHVGLALANVQLYDLERVRRARAESLERVVRMLRDTQTIEEVLLVFAVTVSHEVKLTCAAYEIDKRMALRRALRAAEHARGGAAERVELGAAMQLLEREEIAPSGAFPDAARAALFGENEGIAAALRIDGNLWGFFTLTAAPGLFDWSDSERRLYFHMLASHLELALSGALGFERIQQLARALSESNEFKDDLLAMLAHDFKGPLTVILGYCELLLESSPEMREEIETIYQQTQRLVRLSDDAVGLAHTQAGSFAMDLSTVDLRQVVGQSVKAHNRGHNRIQLMEPGEPVLVELDTARFNHVLDNLLMNALKYSEGEVVVRLTRGDAGAVIAISDRGIGIPQSELGAVFARFGRASNARRKGISGSGVGLYVSRKIAELHGGSIAVQSTEGEGSTFTVTLPLSAAGAAAEQP